MSFVKWLDGGIGYIEQTCSLPFTCHNLDSGLFQTKNENSFDTFKTRVNVYLPIKASQTVAHFC